ELKHAIAGMSHDLRTPLTSITCYLQLLENNQLSTEKRNEYLQIAQNQSVRLQKLINDFFTLSVIDSSDHPVHLERNEINTLVKESLLTFYDQFHAKQIDLVTNLTHEVCLVMVDEQACRRILENIFSNIIQ